MDRETIQGCLTSGVPVLSAMNLEIDFQEFSRLMMQLVRAVELMQHNGNNHARWKIWHNKSDPLDDGHQLEINTLKGMAAEIRMAIETGQLDLSEVLEFVSMGDNKGLERISHGSYLDPGLLLLLAKNTLKPTLNYYRKEIQNLLPTIHWERGFCFVCGSMATLGELQENDQVKHLRCGQCGADWHFNRLECTHCGNLDHRTQRIISETGCESRRIDACDACHGYLKVISSFLPTPPELLAVEDLETLPLDFIAQQRGYNSIASV
jgi:hypothetical protein